MRNLYSCILAFILCTAALTAQDRPDTQWQYEPFPDLPFTLNEIQLDLNINPASALIEGVGRYQLTARQPGLSEVVFNTSDIEIQSVFAGEQEIDFWVSEDSLIMPLPDTLNHNESTELLITWQSTSPYGIHKDVYGNMWTSLNPKARRHWFPVPDHPRMETQLEVTMTIPAENNAVMNGAFVDDEVISADQKTVRWSSGNTVPVTAFSLAIGNFKQESARSGVHVVSIFSGENVLLEGVKSSLLRQAVSSLKEYQDKLSFEYPYESLNIVVLPDHQWEEIHTGAGIIYLYQNLGSLTAQLRRAIAEQWLGNHHRYIDAPKPKYEFLKTALVGASRSNILKNPDSLKSIEAWNVWQQAYDTSDQLFFKETVVNSLPRLIQEIEGVTSWQRYAEFWHNEIGSFWKDLDWPELKGIEEKTSDDSTYDVYYNYDEGNSKLGLIFEARDNAIETLVGLQLIEYGFSDTTRSEISFTGTQDSVSVQLSPSVEFVTLSNQSEEEFKLVEHKPLMFLINQLRSTDPKERAKAAIQLQEYSDEPDLQLALRDVLRTEKNEEVRAALYSTLSDITGGDTGTERTFLNLINSDNDSIRVTAINALANYPDNDEVAYAIQNVLKKTTSDTVFQASLDTYQEIASTEDLLHVVGQLEQNGHNVRKAIQILEYVAPKDTSGKAVELADQYLQYQYPYSIRNAALKLLLSHQQQESYWEQELESLLGDRDPRIRFLALDALKNLSEEKVGTLLEVRAKEEFDPRILKKIESLRW